MDFLGVCINKQGITIDPAKIAGLRDYPHILKNLKQVQGFLGVAGYHCMFVLEFLTIVAPLTCLTHKDVPFIWDQKCMDAQEEIIKWITNAPVLVPPDTNHQFKLETDTSQVGTGTTPYLCDKPVTLPDGTQKPGPC